MTSPRAGDHGHIVADVLQDTGVTVVAVTDSAIEMKFDKRPWGEYLPSWTRSLRVRPFRRDGLARSAVVAQQEERWQKPEDSGSSPDTALALR